MILTCAHGQHQQERVMTQPVKAFALYASSKGYLGGVLYDTREEAERGLTDFLRGGSSVSGYDSVIELNCEVPLPPGK